MIITARRLILVLGALACVLGAALWIALGPSAWRWLAGALIALGPIGVIAWSPTFC